MRNLIAVMACPILLSACGQGADTNSSGPSNASGVGEYDALVEYRGERFEMVVPGDCGARSDGTYLTWAITMDAAGEPDPDAAHLYAMRTPEWSVIDFYYPPNESIVRIYREGRNRIDFKEGELDFDGELGAGLTEKATVRIECPEQIAARTGGDKDMPQ